MTSLGRGGAPCRHHLQIKIQMTVVQPGHVTITASRTSTFLAVDAEPQVEGDDPGHGPRVRPHAQGAPLSVQQGEQRRHVRQPASRPPVGQKPVHANLGRTGQSRCQ